VPNKLRGKIGDFFMWKDIVKASDEDGYRDYDRIRDTLKNDGIIEGMFHLLEQEGKLNGDMSPYDAVEKLLKLLEEHNSLPSMNQVLKMIAQGEERFAMGF
jgi:hypothetical protein